MPEKQHNREWRWAKKLSTLLDSQYRIPGTNWRFGLDPILGLIPLAGDAISLTLSSLLVLSLWRYPSSGEVKAKLIVNVLLDFLVGSIPILGNVFDFYFKANTRNLKLIEEYYDEGKHRGRARGVAIQWLIVVFLLLLLLASLLGLAIYGLIELLDR